MVFSVFRPITTSNASRSPQGPRRLFRTSSSTAPTASIPQATALPEDATSTEPVQPDLTDLNESLAALAAIFPDVRPEVFREMLSIFSGESRLQIVAEQLLKHKAKWVKDRWRIASKGISPNPPREVYEVDRQSYKPDNSSGTGVLPVQEQFRTESYKQAVRSMLCQEFKNLSRSTVDGVLAEQNHSYTSSRPVLLGLAAKSWRISLSTILSKWKKSTQPVPGDHFMLVWNGLRDGSSSITPTLKESGNRELDMELYNTVLKPLLQQRKQDLEGQDLEIVVAINEKEAEEANAFHECECCFSNTTFEHMATCTTGAHTICFTCIQHAASEALYGQSWGLNIDHIRGQIACLAPTSSTPCNGCIPQSLANRAITSTKGGPQTWQKFSSRLADEALLKFQAPLIRCPFCTYAELDDLYLPPLTLRYRLNTSHPLRALLLLFLPLNFFPLLLCYTLLTFLLPLPTLRALLSHALQTLTRSTHLSPRFQCRSPTCSAASCLLCQKPWRDPHICHESAHLSLRTTVEAARTAALKRTCPRCGLGFVKDSGCNKMLCVCGYSMCYVCRQGLGNMKANVGGGEGGRGGEGEGYRHFCQHFRPKGGRCAECERCDLYRGEDEDEVVKKAGERAEREWRIREGWADGGVTGGSVGVGMGKGIEIGGMGAGVKGKGSGGLGIAGFDPKEVKWGLQEGVDWWVGKVLKC